MNTSLTTPDLMGNTSFLDQTSLPSNNSQTTLIAAYHHNDVTTMLWTIVPPVLLVLGCYGNVMTIVVMRAMRASESTGCLSVYFTALAVSDLFVLGVNVLWYWPGMVLNFHLSYFHDLTCTVPFFVSEVSSMMAAWSLVAMTCQRMLSVLLPHRVEILCTVSRGKILTAAILIISCMATLQIFFYFRIVYTETGYPACVSSVKNVTDMFSFLYLCLASVIPFLVLVLTNSILILKAIQSVKMSGKIAGHTHSQTHTRLEKISSMTTTLILTSIAFLLLTSPYYILFIYHGMIGYYEGEIVDEAVLKQLASAESVCALIWLSNSSVNFYIYILSGRKFREEAKRHSCLCLKQH